MKSRHINPLLQISLQKRGNELQNLTILHLRQKEKKTFDSKRSYSFKNHNNRMKQKFWPIKLVIASLEKITVTLTKLLLDFKNYIPAEKSS